MKIFNQIIGLCTISVLLTACASQTAENTSSMPATTQHSATTNNQTKAENLTLKRNVTTKEQIINVFGAPDIVTPRDNGAAVWIYQTTKNLYGEMQKNGAFSLTQIAKNNSQKPMTIILHFDSNGRVISYKGLETSL